MHLASYVLRSHIILRLLWSLLLGLTLTASVTFAADLKTFENGQVAKAEDVNANFQELARRIAELTTMVAEQQQTIQMLTKHIRVEETTLNGLRGPHVIFSGANVHIRSGSPKNATDDRDLAQNNKPSGLGNLIVGYNEDYVLAPRERVDDGRRVGSHNLIVGPEHRYKGVGGLLPATGMWLLTSMPASVVAHRMLPLLPMPV